MWFHQVDYLLSCKKTPVIFNFLAIRFEKTEFIIDKYEKAIFSNRCKSKYKFYKWKQPVEYCLLYNWWSYYYYYDSHCHRLSNKDTKGIKNKNMKLSAYKSEKCIKSRQEIPDTKFYYKKTIFQFLALPIPLLLDIHIFMEVFNLKTKFVQNKYSPG